METPDLDPDRIVGTVASLCRRIEERFPGSGLLSTGRQLFGIAGQARDRAAWIARPIAPLRAASAALVASILACLAYAVATIRPPAAGFDLALFIQVLEAGINAAVLVGAAVFFLASLETRIKRRRALQAIHELRALAHIIDMHQLTKDPDRLSAGPGATPSSPERRLTRAELGRYLDYCSELLSLAGKVSAIYVRDFDDAVTLASVNEIEDLTAGLSRKIWQKLMILHTAGA